MNAFVMPHM